MPVVPVARIDDFLFLGKDMNCIGTILHLYTDEGNANYVFRTKEMVWFLSAQSRGEVLLMENDIKGLRVLLFKSGQMLWTCCRQP